MSGKAMPPVVAPAPPPTTGADLLARVRALRSAGKLTEASVLFQARKREIEAAMQAEEEVVDATAKDGALQRIALAEAKGFTELAKYQRMLLDGRPTMAAVFFGKLSQVIQEQRAALESGDGGDPPPEAA